MWFNQKFPFLIILFSYARSLLAWIKRENKELYHMLDSNDIRGQVIMIRRKRMKLWRSKVLPKE